MAHRYRAWAEEVGRLQQALEVEEERCHPMAWEAVEVRRRKAWVEEVAGSLGQGS